MPMAGTQVLFSVWDTRVQDFETFVKSTDYDATGLLGLRFGRLAHQKNEQRVFIRGIPNSPSLFSAPVPALIDRAGEGAAWRFLEFFTVNIRNKNTRADYGQAAAAFLRWCECRGITCIQDVRPVHVAGYIEQLQATRIAPSQAWNFTSV